jgi:putative toxin-antitoxin system antitoxin component (TIGR02293 family)
MSPLLIAHADAVAAYRVLLQAFLHIPVQATDLAIHYQIQARFSADLLKGLVDTGFFSREACEIVMASKACSMRPVRHQLLSVNQSDRLFRIARVTAMAGVVFGTREKAFRWLNTPEQRFLGSSPVGMLSTIVGAKLVEETLKRSSGQAANSPLKDHH